MVRRTNAISFKRDPNGGGLRAMGDEVREVEATYHVDELKPREDGPWRMEAEKVAWTDAATGLGCIVRRAKGTGHLCGYVAVPKNHPLYGWDEAAIRQLGVLVHGGVDYARECQHYEHESISVCHVPAAEVRKRTAARDARRRAHAEQARHDELWWIGFSCNQPYDLVPHPARDAFADGPTAGTVDREYRDEGYVLRQCESLAAQLKAVGDGKPLPPPAPMPAIGLDPRQTGAN